LIPYWCKDPTGGRKPINAKAETVARRHFGRHIGRDVASFQSTDSSSGKLSRDRGPSSRMPSL
jgi:hypothetical protein